MADDDTRRIIAAIDMLPALTRTVYLLASLDEMPWPDIARRSGLSTAEVELRLTAALSSLRHALDDGPSIAMRARSALRPWRASWAAWRIRARDRRLGLSPRRRGGDEAEGDSSLPTIGSKIRGLVRRWRRQPP